MGKSITATLFGILLISRSDYIGGRYRINRR